MELGVKLSISYTLIFQTDNNTHTSLQKIQCDVPQDSPLGPLLFLIYINDLTNAISTTLRLYADDTCLIVNSPSQRN